jgi:hypothetical protein
MYGPLGEGVEFDYRSPVPEDKDREASERTSKIDGLMKLIQYFEPPEVLEFLGLPPMTLKVMSEPQPAGPGDPQPEPEIPAENDPESNSGQSEGEED